MFSHFRRELRPDGSLPPAARMDPEATFLSALDSIDRIVAALCRRHTLAGEDAADFGSWVKMKLVEDEYAVLRKFRGESSLATYLTVVIAMLFRDYLSERWGRWRPSAEAQRRGRLAIHLETLVYRDGYRLAQVGELLRTSGETELADRELAALLGALPVRTPMRPENVGPKPLADAPAPARADDQLLAGEAEHEHRAAASALSRAMACLPPEDRLILRMRFWEGMSVADVARGLNLPQKPLYRRIGRALAELRKHLETAGISREMVQALLAEVTS